MKITIGTYGLVPEFSEEELYQVTGSRGNGVYILTNVLTGFELLAKLEDIQPFYLQKGDIYSIVNGTDKCEVLGFQYEMNKAGNMKLHVLNRVILNSTYTFCRSMKSVDRLLTSFEN